MGINSKTMFIARLAILISLTLVIQVAGFPQPVTGPLINAMLFLTTVFVGGVAGVTLGGLTPLLALIRGQLPTVLAPMVPFIFIGNALLVLVFYFGIKQHLILNKAHDLRFYVSLIVAGVFKFVFLFLSAQFVLPIVFGHEIQDKYVVLMSTPQLLTAWAGGLIAALFIKILQRSGIFHPSLKH